jgi:hypothetical protein
MNDQIVSGHEDPHICRIDPGQIESNDEVSAPFAQTGFGLQEDFPLGFQPIRYVQCAGTSASQELFIRTPGNVVVNALHLVQDCGPEDNWNCCHGEIVVKAVKQKSKARENFLTHGSGHRPLQETLPLGETFA